MLMKQRKLRSITSKEIIIVVTTFLVIVVVFFSWYCTHIYPKTFIFFEDAYYSVLGASVNEGGVGEKVGEIERTSLRTFWNKSGDSNHVPVGSGIYTRADPECEGELLIGISYMDYTDMGGGQIEVKYWILEKEK